MTRLAWRSRTTGKSGHGQWLSDGRGLDGAVESLNRDNPSIHHWIEHGEPPALPATTAEQPAPRAGQGAE